jgi:hydrogenase/urease accessory protein HupE
MLRKNHLHGWLAALFMSVAGLARAHDPGLSTATLKVFPDRLEAEVIFARGDVEALVPLDVNHDGEVSPEELDRARPQLEPLVHSALSVLADGAALGVSGSSFRLDDLNNFHITGIFRTQDAKVVAVESPLLKTLPRGLRQFVSLFDDQGTTLAEALLSAEQNVIELDLPQHVAAESPPANTGTFPDFFRMGVEHILTGYDHLLFLFALLIAISQFRATLWVITCFTLAHSATLALAAFDIVRIPRHLIEPMIAVTIIYVGVENLLRPDYATARWKFALLFGLVHGLGFATELKEKVADLTGERIVIPLLSFNLGVELGQIAIAALVLPVIWWFRNQQAVIRVMVPSCSVFVILAGAWWLVERTLLE